MFLRIGILLALCAWPLAGAFAAGPAANFRTDPGRGEVPLTVRFHNTSNGGVAPLAFHWEFGDGETSRAEHPTHVYQVPRDFEVKLTVTDYYGQTDVKNDIINVDGPTLVAALLPVSRSVVIGNPATAFITVINAGHVTATGVTIELDPTTGPGGAPLPGALTFQTTDAATNVVNGAPNAPVDIPAGGRQSFLMTVTPAAALSPIDVRFDIGGTNTTRDARTVIGLNTLLLSSSMEATPDIVALAVTPDANGILALSGSPAAGAFSVATVNVGAGGSITASADVGTASLPVGIVLCRTNPATGECTSDVGTSVPVLIGPGGTPTFAVFVTASGPVPYDPEVNRIFVRFKDASGATRGATSVAVKAP